MQKWAADLIFNPQAVVCCYCNLFSKKVGKLSELRRLRAIKFLVKTSRKFCPRKKAKLKTAESYKNYCPYPSKINLWLDWADSLFIPSNEQKKEFLLIEDISWWKIFYSSVYLQWPICNLKITKHAESYLHIDNKGNNTWNNLEEFKIAMVNIVKEVGTAEVSTRKPKNKSIESIQKPEEFIGKIIWIAEYKMQETKVAVKIP